jgi:SsrA-binding protein
MAKPLSPPFDKQKVVAENRRARFDYFIEEKFEAGIQLAGTEVKALRQGEEIWLINSHIPEYSHGNRLNHEPRRNRKLLLKGREIAKLQGAVTREGLTLVPLSIYFNARGKAKVEIALARGKKVHDKRETIKERDWKRDQQRLLRRDA